MSLSALPLDEVVLYTSGVGEFVHKGTVQDEGTIRVSVPEDAMSDVLRSLVLMDHGGGTVESVTFATGENVATRLGRFSVDLTDVHRLHEVLRYFRGVAVEVEIAVPRAPSAASDDTAELAVEENVLSGTLLGAEEHSLLISRDGGLREIPLWQVEDLRFSDARAQREFDTALTALTDAALESDLRDLEIAYTGRGERVFEIRYLREMPRWHTTYRVVLRTESGSASVQGWAHVDNTSTVDWDDVRLTVVSAHPVTYRFDLYEPQYVARPAYRDGDTPVEAMMYDRRTATVQPETVSRHLPTGMSFTVPDRVSVPRGRSAMIPLVHEEFSADVTRHYDPRRDDQRPRAAFTLVNDGTDLLPPGPVTVYHRDRYAGDGSMPTLLPGAETVITYAHDADIRIITSADTGDEELVTTRITDGVLLTEHRTRHTTTYRTRSSTGVLPGRRGTSPILISHPLRSGWELVSPSGAETDGERATIRSTGTGSTVVEQRLRSRRYALTDIDDDVLAVFSSDRLIDPTVRRTLQNITTLRSALADHRRTRRELEERRDEIFDDQRRISTNMAQLEHTSSLYRRYASDLSRQEDELRRLREDLGDARREETQAETALRDYLRTLGVD